MSTLRKVPSIEHFFRNKYNLAWNPLPNHRLEQSPCYPIIGSRNRHNNKMLGHRNVDWYYCKIHPNVESIHLESIEHHCKYKEPDKHERTILEFLQLLLSNSNREAK